MVVDDYLLSPVCGKVLSSTSPQLFFVLNNLITISLMCEDIRTGITQSGLSQKKFRSGNCQGIAISVREIPFFSQALVKSQGILSFDS